MNQRWRPMESGVSNKRRIVRTNGNVLWPNQLSSYLPNYDEYHICPGNSGTMANSIHGRHGHTYTETGRRNRTATHRTTSHIRPTYPRKTSRAQSLPQTRKMHFQTTPNRIPQSNSRPRNGTNGRQKGRKSKELATTGKRDRSMKIPRLHRILSILHSRLLTHCPTTPRPNNQ